MKQNIFFVWVAIVCFAVSTHAQNRTQQVTAIQYFFNNDPGVGVAGNGAIVAVTPTSSLNQTFSFILPNTLTTGFNNLYVRAQDEFGRWSLAERRLFLIQPVLGTENITVYQYYFDTDPGVDVAGNGAVVPITQTANYSATVAISVPNTLASGFHNLYVRVKDVSGQWSLAERRLFLIQTVLGTENITAYQYYFDTDPGVGVSGNGAIVPVTQTANYSTTVAISVPISLSTGFHNLYVRTKDESGQWSIAERRLFFIQSVSGTENLTAYQYYFDTDPGVGVAGNGAVIPITPTANYSATVAISVPNTLAAGFHNLYVRTKDVSGQWSLTERRLIIIQTTGTENVIALEYYFDNDPGVGNGNAYPITSTGNFTTTIALNAPCLSNGSHYLYVRAKDVSGQWSIIERDTVIITSGIAAAVVTPTGPVSICPNDAVTLSANLVPGLSYQWLLNGVAISGATTNSLLVNAAGNYSLKTTCGSSFVTSNVVSVTINPNVIAGTISGNSPLCINTTAIYSSIGNTGGTWSSTNTSVATVNPSSGLVTSVSEGTTDITYTLNTGCGSPASSFKTLTVTHNANPGTVSGNSPLCIGRSDQFSSDGESGGTWSSSNPNVATVNSITGLVTCLSAGTTNIMYTLANNNCPRSSQRSLIVNLNANAGIINGSISLCIGANTTYTSNGDANGTWSSNDNTIATINPTTGVLTALSAGLVTIKYTVNTGCNSPVSSSINLTISPNVNAGIISGTTPLCLGQTTTYSSNGATGGSWSSSNSNIASVDATTGFVTALNGGSVDIQYTVNTGCGSPISTFKTLTINALPIGNAGIISGATPVCIGNGIFYTSDGDTGGIWSSDNNAVATVNATTGEVTTVSAGSATIFYTVSGCNGPVVSQKKTTVNPNVSAGNISGASSLCIGSNSLFTNNGTSGGNWSSSNNLVATVDPNTGMVNALSAGNANIIYTITGCGGTFVSSKTVMVSALVNAGSISGVTTLCLGETTTFTSNGTSGGTWTSSNPTVASVNSTSGLITALSNGTVSINYSVVGCNGSTSSLRFLTIKSIASAGLINGVSSLCVGATTIYTNDGISGGIWTSSNPAVVTIDASTGLATALQTGNSAITYTVTGCNNTFSTSKAISIAGHAPVFSFSGNSHFTSSVVFPVKGEPSFNYRFEVKYTNASGELPAAGFPRLMLDYEGNGKFTDPKDINIIMSPVDPSDQDVINGKIYYAVLSGLQLGTNWTVSFYARTTGGCEAQSPSFTGPKVTLPPNLSIFADDISFSDNHPTPSSTITVFAKIHNDSSQDIHNFFVHLINQYSGETYPDIFIPILPINSSTIVSWTITTPALAAWVPMQVVIDYTDVIDETNELDNQAIRPFTNGNFIVPGNIKVTAGGAPTACQHNFYTVCGHAIYEHTAVVLQDNSVAGALVTVTVNETGQTFNGFTNSQGDYCVSFLASNNIGTYSLEISITDFTITGNANSSFSVIVCPTPPPPVGADLVSKITLDSYEVFSGSPITGKVRITNFGNQPSSASIAEVYLSNLLSAALQLPTPSLAPGEFYTTTFSLISALGNGQEAIFSVADATNIINEINENNNSDEAGVRICPLQPDLASGYPFPDIQPVYLCEDSLTLVISNQTCLPINSSFDIQLQVFQNSTLVNSLKQTINSIVSRDNGMYVGFKNVFPSAGDYVVKLLADVNNSIAEFDESNNVFTSPFTVLECKPDLSISVECSPITPVDPTNPGNITVHTTLLNGGHAPAIAPFIVEFEEEGNHYPVTISSNLPANSSIPVSITFPTPTFGCPYVTATADATHRIDEYHENDNTDTIQLSWDFFLKRQCYEFDPDDPQPNPNFWEETHNVGQPVPLAVGLVNHSNYTASLVQTRFEVSGPQISGWLDLGAANVTDVAHSCDDCGPPDYEIHPYAINLPNSFAFPAEGIYKVRMTADWDNRYIECNENNNVMIVDVTISNLPDYRTLSSYIEPSLLNPEVGEPITIDVTYQNIGVSNILDSINILVKVDDLPHEIVRAKGLLNGATFTAHCNNQWASMKAGLHVIRAITDSDNKIHESDELNNEATRSIVVGKAADLYFQVFAPDNYFPSLGQSISMNARIGNRGALASEADVQFFYLNDLHDTIPIGLIHISIAAYDSGTISLPWIVLDNSTTLIARIINLSILQIRNDDKEAIAILDNMGISIESTDACYGGQEGMLAATMFGGNPPYTFTWNTGATSAAITAPPGTYTVTAMDAAGVKRTKEGRIKSIFAPSWYEDADGDGYGNPASIIEDCTQPPGYVADNTDCDDRHSDIHPGASEICNGIDDNCDRQIDEGLLIAFYKDEDGDGYGDINLRELACTLTVGFVADSSDCNDTRSSAHPGAEEICNGIDDDCDDGVDEGVTLTFYADADGDGYGDINSSTEDCSPPEGYVADNTDCNDDPGFGGATINPGAPEVCNGIDDNCNNQIDEGLLRTFYRDADRDGFGNPNVSVIACSAPAGYVDDKTDCNDASAAINPAATEICNGIDDNCNNVTDDNDPDVVGQSTWFADTDGDGYGDPNVSILSCNQPPAHVADNTDCDDTQALIHPGLNELCNHLDDNCDGQIDEGVKLTFYHDADGDGYGTPTDSIKECSQPSGYTVNKTDCDDSRSSVHPGATETCNSMDDNCNGQIDEGVKLTFYRDADGDGFGNPAVSTLACSVPAGYVSNNTDCDDTKASVHPGATETCNSTDDNCDGQIDEGVKLTFYRDGDGDGFGNPAVSTLACSAPVGYVADNTDCDDSRGNVHPGATEACNSMDDNCNGQIDEGVKLTFYRDADGDGYGNNSVSTLACTAPSGYVSDHTDCDDSKVSIHPGATEICNGLDDNCDGTIDEGCNGCHITIDAGPDVTTYFGYTVYQTIVRSATVSKGIAPYNFVWTLNRPLKCNITVADGDEIFAGGNCINTTCPSGNTPTTLSSNPSCSSSSSSISATLLDSAIACVTVTDSKGCKATDCFVIHAIDERCFAGNSQNHKVIICHSTGSKTNPWVELCIDESALNTHLAHGDYIGKCNLANRGSSGSESVMQDLEVYPNPTHIKLNVLFRCSKPDDCIIQLMDLAGRVSTHQLYHILPGNVHIELNVDGFASGIYLLSIKNNEGSRVVMVMVE